jgi:diguanylate cyclase (GGDEF)-like protein
MSMPAYWPENEAPEASEALELSGVRKLVGELDELRAEAERLRARVRELEALADTDAMLPVYNKRAFLRESARVMAIAHRHKLSAALLFLDLDGFKAINDTHGHGVGDRILEAVAFCLLQQVRETDIVGRLGGDEFAVMLAASTAEGAQAKAATLQREIEALCISIQGEEVGVGVSMGVEIAGNHDTPETLLERADAAMYAQKEARRDSLGVTKVRAAR